jgi:hypothetical protein
MLSSRRQPSPPQQFQNRQVPEASGGSKELQQAALPPGCLAARAPRGGALVRQRLGSVRRQYLGEPHEHSRLARRFCICIEEPGWVHKLRRAEGAPLVQQVEAAQPSLTQSRLSGTHCLLPPLRLWGQVVQD